MHVRKRDYDKIKDHTSESIIQALLCLMSTDCMLFSVHNAIIIITVKCNSKDNNRLATCNRDTLNLIYFSWCQ